MTQYQNAVRQFTENVNKVDRTEDALTWNLNAGLGNLTEALSQDFAAVRSQLQQISQKLWSIEQKLKK